MYKYDDDFYSYIDAGARRSAELLLPTLLQVLPSNVRSVLDVGCGAGAWLSVWKSLDSEVLGLDGSYVKSTQLLIKPEEFRAIDVSRSFELDKTFDLVQCLEVAEHLPKSAAATLVSNLCQHAPIVLFSAATPGQGGENHVNEQTHSYWRALFQRQGFTMYDPVRKKIVDDARIMSWYRYNTFLYVHDHCAAELGKALESYRVDAGSAPVDFSPLSYRLRTRLIALLPANISTMLAVCKKSLFISFFKIRKLLLGKRHLS